MIAYTTKEKIKEISNWVNVTFEDIDTPYKDEHFAFGFKTQNLQDILSFQFTLLVSNRNKIEFVDDERKVTFLNFKIDILNLLKSIRRIIVI